MCLIVQLSSSEKVRNGPDYFGGMGRGGCWGVMVIGKLSILSATSDPLKLHIIAIYLHITIPTI